jgi:hypothetical protein
LFWVIPVPNDSVEVHLGTGQASFRLTTTIFDDHDIKSSLTKVYPAGFPKMAEVTFDVEWGGIIDTAHVTNETSNFEGDFAYTGSTIQWSARDPDTGFQFMSEPPNPSRLVGAVLGREHNGVFFE